MGYRERFDKAGLDANTARQAGSFLFDTGQQGKVTKKEAEIAERELSQGLEMRTIIKGSATMAALTFYGILRDGFNSEAAKKVSDVIKRLAVSDNGEGRVQAVDVLRGSLPKEIEVRTGQA